MTIKVQSTHYNTVASQAITKVEHKIFIVVEVYARDRLKRDSAKQPLTPAEYRRMQP